MTDNQINIAIAKTQGWTHFTPDKIQYTARRSDGKWEIIPDYCNNLNAMHEAINTLSDDQISSFSKHLKKITKPPFGTPHFRKRWWKNFLTASARQRAEAYLRALNH